MIAHQQEGGDARPGEAHHALAPFALECGGGIAVFISIPRKDDQVNFFGDGRIHDFIQRLEEIHHPQRESGLRVVAAVVGHVDMGVGEM